MTRILARSGLMIAGLVTVYALLLGSFYQPSSLDGLAFGSNYTESITIDIEDNESTLLINYSIVQVFNEPSRGIFISLPKNQDGIWTDYSLLEVQRSLEPSDISQDDETAGIELMNEKSSRIIEWNEFRVRFGDADTYLEEGKYLYTFSIEATKNNMYQYSFVPLRDWSDPVEDQNITINLNGDTVCSTSLAQCSPTYSYFTANQDTSDQRPPEWLEAIPYASMYGVIGLILIILGYVAWVYLAKNPHPLMSNPAPQFEQPKDLMPWEAQFLASDGSISIKNTLLSYILYLNNKKYISLQPDNDPFDKKSEVTITIKKKLPDLLPVHFNKAVELSGEKGLKKGVKSSKLSNETDAGKLRKQLSAATEQYFTHKPLGSGNAFGLSFLLGAIFGVVSFVIYGWLQNIILLGNSFRAPLFFVCIGFFVIALITLLNWSKPTREGAKKIDEARGYKHYLEYAEKEKLDFSNNPDEGVQYYLQSVPYAAAFGILEKFNGYFTKIMPDMKQTATTTSLLNNYALVSLYTPPSSSSGGFSSGSSGGFSGGGGSW